MQIPSRLFDINSVPPDSNPYSFLAQRVLIHERPITPKYVRPVFILVAIINAVICVCCAAFTLLPYFRGAEVKARHIWILKRQYLGNHITPYYILNNVMVIGLSHLISAILYELFIALELNTLSSGVSLKVHRFSWIEILKLPSQCGIFIQAFTLLFISASNPASGFKKYFFPPLVFNAMLICFPIVATISSLVLTAQKSIAVKRQDNSTQFLLALLSDAADQWTVGTDVTDAQKDFFQSVYETYLQDSLTKLESRRHIGLFWSFMGLPSIVFYVGGISALVSTVYKPDTVLIPKRQSKNETLQELKTSRSKETDTYPISFNQGDSLRLKRSLKFLWSHYFVMSVGLCLDVGLGLGYYINKSNMLNPQLSGMFFFINIAGSVFIMIGMMILLARIIIEGRGSIGSDRTHSKAHTQVPSKTVHRDEAPSGHPGSSEDMRPASVSRLGSIHTPKQELG